MGWVSSPEKISTCTKTIADLTIANLADPCALELAQQAPNHFYVISESNPENDLANPTTLAVDLESLSGLISTVATNKMISMVAYPTTTILSISTLNNNNINILKTMVEGNLVMGESYFSI